mgnify:CR=1 FL=1
MRIGLILFSILFLYSCKKDVKITDISGDCILEKGSIVKKDTSKLKEPLYLKLPKKLKIKSFEENPNKIIFIERESITEHLDFEFVYKKLNKKNEGNIVTFSSSNISIEIQKEKFKNKDSYIKDSFEGVNYDFPIEIISSIKIIFDNQEINESNIVFSDLAEPNFNLTKVYQIDSENVILEMHNSDGAGGYAVYFFINKNGSNKRYIIYP